MQILVRTGREYFLSAQHWGDRFYNSAPTVLIPTFEKQCGELGEGAKKSQKKRGLKGWAKYLVMRYLKSSICKAYQKKIER